MLDISVIVAHDSRRGNVMLDLCLASIYKELDLLSLDDVSQEVIVESEGNASEARNLAAANARGKILVFIDDDAELRPGSLRELLAPFQDDKVGIVGGPNIPFPNISEAEVMAASLMASPLLMLKSASRYTSRGNIRESDESELLSCFMAVRADAFRLAGGFPVDIIPCEENVLINRIQADGWRVLYNPFAVVYHKRPKLLWPYLKTIYHYGYGRGLMMRKLGRDGKPQLFWRPSWRWPAYFVAAVLHVFSYSSGLIVGFYKNKNHKIDKTSLEAKKH